VKPLDNKYCGFSYPSLMRFVDGINSLSSLDRIFHSEQAIYRVHVYYDNNLDCILVQNNEKEEGENINAALTLECWLFKINTLLENNGLEVGVCFFISTIDVLKKVIEVNSKNKKSYLSLV
jgi:hypothetical protein